MRIREMVAAVDQLLAGFLMEHPEKLPSNTSVLELLEWGHKLTANAAGITISSPGHTGGAGKTGGDPRLQLVGHPGHTGPAGPPHPNDAHLLQRTCALCQVRAPAGLLTLKADQWAPPVRCTNGRRDTIVACSPCADAWMQMAGRAAVWRPYPRAAN